MKWIYHFGCDDFDRMSNVNKAAQAAQGHCRDPCPRISREQRSADGTIKWKALQVGDREVGDRLHSGSGPRDPVRLSQVGCALACTFLHPPSRVSTATRKVSGSSVRYGVPPKWWAAKRPITNVVMMGMVSRCSTRQRGTNP